MMKRKMKTMNKAAPLAAALILTMAGCSEKAEAPAEQAMPAGTKMTVAMADIADMKAVAATITTRDAAAAPARIPGTLVALEVREGDRVKKGQRIALITDSRIGSEAEASRAQAVAAEAEAVRARAELARVEDLYRNNVYAKARLDQAVASARAAEAQARAARAQAAAGASVVGQGAILAPADGRILTADVPVGAVVAPGMTIATVTAGPPVLRLELPESLAGQIRVGSVVNVTDPAYAGARQGRITQVYPAISGGRIKADAALPGLSDQLVGRRLATAVEVGRRQAIVVPRTYVSTRFGLDYVDIATPGQGLSAVTVQTAPTGDPATIEILSGVRPGDVLFAAKGAGQ